MKPICQWLPAAPPIAATMLAAGPSLAGPEVYDIPSAFSPVVPPFGGMVGTSPARPQELTSAIYGNPASLTKIKSARYSF